MGLLIGKEDALFSPGKALGQQGKGLATQGMKGVSDGKALLTIRVIRGHHIFSGRAYAKLSHTPLDACFSQLEGQKMQTSSALERSSLVRRS